MTTHVRIGDPPSTIGMGGTSSTGMCFCCCDRCNAGDCCSAVSYVPTTRTSTASVPPPNLVFYDVCPAGDTHWFEQRTDGGGVFCRKCAEGRRIRVPKAAPA